MDQTESIHNLYICKKIIKVGYMFDSYLVTKLAKTVKNIWVELTISCVILMIITLILSLCLFLAESKSNIVIFNCLGETYKWIVLSYFDMTMNFSATLPKTIVGEIVFWLIVLIKLAVFVVPIGIVTSGFTEAVKSVTRQNELNKYKEKIKKAFWRRQCRYTKWRVVPRYLSIVDLQVITGLDSKDIIETVADSKELRLCNLASTLNVGKYPQDKLVVEYFLVNRNYGFCLKSSSKSNVTIVSTTSTENVCIGSFSYYLAKAGDFNYVSREYQEPFSRYSYYNIDNDKHDEYVNDFLKDINSFKSKWVIFIIASSGQYERSYDTHFHFLHGAKKGDSTYNDSEITVEDTITYDNFYIELSNELEKRYELLSDQQLFHNASSKKYIGRHVECENAFTIRIDWSVLAWSDRYLEIIKTITEVINKHLDNNKSVDFRKLEKKGVGYD